MKLTEAQIRAVIKQELVKILNEMDETGMVPRAPSEIPEVMSSEKTIKDYLEKMLNNPKSKSVHMMKLEMEVRDVLKLLTEISDDMQLIYNASLIYQTSPVPQIETDNINKIVNKLLKKILGS
jgi:hypothetical protein